MRISCDDVFGEIDSLPGCSQVGVSHAVYVPLERRGTGAGTRAHNTRLTVMRETLGYDYAMCTVDASNRDQTAILSKAGWRELDRFLSSKTGHMVLIYGKGL